MPHPYTENLKQNKTKQTKKQTRNICNLNPADEAWTRLNVLAAEQYM